MMQNIQTHSKVITLEICSRKIYCFPLFAGLDNFLLVVVAYEHFVTISHPLRYTITMNLQLWGLMVLVSWVMSAMNSLLQSLVMLGLSFYADLDIPTFSVAQSSGQLACSVSFLNNVMIHFAAALLGGVPVAEVLYLYSKRVSSIHGISSFQGKHKALSICPSYLSVVSFFYCMCL